MRDARPLQAAAAACSDYGCAGGVGGRVVDSALRAAIHQEMAEHRARFCDAQRQ